MARAVTRVDSQPQQPPSTSLERIATVICDVPLKPVITSKLLPTVWFRILGRSLYVEPARVAPIFSDLPDLRISSMLVSPVWPMMLQPGEPLTGAPIQPSL